MQLKFISHATSEHSLAYVADKNTNFSQLGFDEKAISYIESQIAAKRYHIVFNDYGTLKIIAYFQYNEKASYKTAENCRLAGVAITETCNKVGIKSISLLNESQLSNATQYVAEGSFLANYQFLKYKKEAEKQKNALESLCITEKDADEKTVSQWQNVLDAVCISRDLINEPLSFLTAPQLSKEITALGKKANFKVKVWDKKKIIKNKMGGLLAVNLGSQDPPTFNIMEWKPKNAINEQPIVLVGKGIVYDTGGLSLKPTGNSMDFMKCDMAGAAAVIGGVYAAAKNELPLYVIGLVPATDNRPGENAYVPGDVIKMHSGLTVEVLNTDAEGRMVLADALSYAKQYEPELVIDIATLTGSAVAALGPHGMPLMGTADEATKQQIIDSSFEVHERLVSFPLWEEYQDMMKSDIADLKNVGGRYAGTITAAAFLKNFTDYPWMHIDMAPMGWNHAGSAYRLKNGSGACVRLFYDFLKNRSSKTAE